MKLVDNGGYGAFCAKTGGTAMSVLNPGDKVEVVFVRQGTSYIKTRWLNDGEQDNLPALCRKLAKQLEMEIANDDAATPQG